MGKDIIFVDTEVAVNEQKICDIGAILNGCNFHSGALREFAAFAEGAGYVCGHNIIHHDLQYLHRALPTVLLCPAIDTLYLSPLLFPCRPYHRLVKDDKLLSDQMNNPLNDAHKAMQLFYDEINAFHALNKNMRRIFYCLLNQAPEFMGFFDYIDAAPKPAFGIFQRHFDPEKLIREEFKNKICENADVPSLIRQHPVELAYALALIAASDYHSVTPPWLVKNFPYIDFVIRVLCHTNCNAGCSYCANQLNIHRKLKDFFGYDSFRTYNGEPLQERAAQAAVDGKSLLAVFPTGGGKSITFQLPALMAGQCAHALTVVISPLQSLMKDQVDNLNDIGLVDAVTVNGLQDPIARAEALSRVESGLATILYISPEQLRSNTIVNRLLSRNVERFVIDEAHCFSAWGQDFRVDYLYIGDFIKNYQQEKQLTEPIPVSCFTATAKQKVISDISDYFRIKLGVTLELFTTTADRENLHYSVLFKENDAEKYNALRSLIEQKKCPTIVYVSRTRRTVQLAEKLTSDGFPARPYNGKMDPADKVKNQEAFIRNEVQIIVATSAFGMGVDKKDVRLVIHYDISDSLENYIQEAGRAGRDQSLLADCYVLFNNDDLDKHFILLNQTKLSISEIQQVWKALRDLTGKRPYVCCSALEIARQAGWDDTVSDIETRVKTAVAALERAGYVKRGNNSPKVYASGILAKDMAEASYKIAHSTAFNDREKVNAKRIISSLISSRSIANAGNADAESRVDYLADILGLSKEDVIKAINLMRQENLLADSMDMSAFIYKTDSENRSALILNRFAKLEEFLLGQLAEQGFVISLKELNEAALAAGIKTSTVKGLRTLIYFLTIKGYIVKAPVVADDEAELAEADGRRVPLTPTMELPKLLEKFSRRVDICRFIVDSLYKSAVEKNESNEGETPVQFSLVNLWKQYTKQLKIDPGLAKTTLSDVEDALLYLSKIGSMKLEGGFLVVYNGMEIIRLVLDNRIRYKAEDYKLLNAYYQHKIQQIHIVGEYANLMVKDYNAALKFVRDYFGMDFKEFIAQYFKGSRAKEINQGITPEKYNQIFGGLSDIQAKIIEDASSKYIVVAAGPGSGKTKVLVHKLAALLLLEDVKHEQLLMLTFSRAAATEFKKRLMGLIGNAANFVEIKTFHSYCFDLLGKIGSLDGAENVVRDAAGMITRGEVEQGRITKTVLVLDEAQDMDADDFALVKALMQNNDDMRIVAVGDDDQNIFEFRHADSSHMRSLVNDNGATFYEMVENYRSRANIVALANRFSSTIEQRMKHTPIEAVHPENGRVLITRYTCNNIEEPLVRQFRETYSGESACILTNTNEGALRVLGLLNKNGIRAKLIQDLDKLSLYNLVEVRFFLSIIDKKVGASPVISDSVWKQAKEALQTVYSTSACLENINNMLSEFEAVYSYSKYRSDLETFIIESDFADFYFDDLQTVFVSTIHKSKGREFGSVYMLLSNIYPRNDEIRRMLYVGMTRAKNNLYVHCNTGIFDRFQIDGVEMIVDETQYPEPEEITLHLSYRDVFLDYFKGSQKTIAALRSGQSLSFNGQFLTAEVQGRVTRVAKLSKACLEKIDMLRKKSYSPVSATIQFIVEWKGKEDTEETMILLPDICLRKSK